MENSIGYRDNLAHDIKELRKKGKKNQAKGLLLDEKSTDEYKENEIEHKALRGINKKIDSIGKSIESILNTKENKKPKADPKKVFEDIGFFQNFSDYLFLSKEEKLELDKKINLSFTSVDGNFRVFVYRKDIKDSSGKYMQQAFRLDINENGEIVGYFNDQGAGQSITVETISLLEKIPFFKQVKEKYGIKGIENLSDYDKKNFEKEKQARINKEKEIDAFKDFLEENKGKPRKTLDIKDNDKVASIWQQEGGFVTGSGKGKRYIETLGAGPCIVVAGYDPETKKTGLVHIDATCNSIQAINSILNETGVSKLRLYGGDNSSLEQALKIKKYLDQEGIKILEWDSNVGGYGSKSIIVDSQTGEIFDVVNSRSRMSNQESGLKGLQIQNNSMTASISGKPINIPFKEY